jgi:hypothetical protein
MPTIKDIIENINAARDKAFALRTWVTNSFPRFILTLSLLGIVLVGAEYFYLNHLLDESKAETEAHIQEISLLTEELKYKVAIDYISTCLDSESSSPKLHTWYCEQAAMQYRKLSDKRPQGRVREVVDLHAYRAMKNDVLSYLRGLELLRLSNAPPTKVEGTLNTILGKTVVTLWVLFVAGILAGSYLFLWVIPKRREASPGV